MSRTIESTQAPVNAPAVNTQGLDQVSNAVVNSANTQQTLRIAGLNGERMLEPIPKYVRAPGEKVTQQGNSTIVLGRDRPAARDSGYGGRGHTGAASIDLCAGRKLATTDGLNYDPNMHKDAARIYISQKTDIDRNFNTPGNSMAKSGIAVKADAVRVIGRDSIMLVTRTESANSRGGTTGYGGIQLVANNNPASLQPMVKGNNLVEALREIDERIKEVSTQLLNHIKDQNSFNLEVMQHTHEGTCPVGPVSTFASLSLIPEGIQSALNTMEAIVENLKYRTNMELQEFKYFSGVGSAGINSSYNKVN